MYVEPSLLASRLNIITFAIGSVALYITYNLIRVVYNLFFHPLAKFPGPASRAAFYVPDLWALLKGSPHRDLKELHDQYGDVVRIRPDHLTFNKVDAWKDIYGSRPGKGQLRKDPDFYTTADEPNHIIYSNDADHSRMRRLLSHAFSDAALREQEPTMTKYFDLLVTGLSRKCDAGESVDMCKWYNYLTFDIIGDLCFNESFGALETGEYHVWMNNLFQGIKFARFLRIAVTYKPLMLVLKLWTKLNPKIAEARVQHEQFTKLKTAKRMDSPTNHKDFMTYILRHNDERGMSRSEIMETSGILIIAGSETTATLLSGATYYLLTNPEAYAKAKAEVRSAFPAPGDITLASTARLPYLHAFLEEALRMYPPVPTALPRRTPPEGEYISGVFVPGNTGIAVPQFTAYRSSKYWTEPETFAPERWLEKPPEKYATDTRAIFNPFSTGPRNCIGKNLAYSEMRSAMARMLYHFDMELCDESREWKNQNVFFMWEKPPLKVKLSRREKA